MTEGHASIGAAAREGNNLLLRIAAALVMAPLAIAIAYAGGWLWTGLVTVAAIGLYAEWLAVTGVRNLPLLLLGVLVLLGAAWIESGHFTAANVSIVVALGIVVAAIFSRERRGWAVLGIGYALAASIASTTSSSEDDGKSPINCVVSAGFRSSIASPPRAGTHSPLMKFLKTLVAIEVAIALPLFHLRCAGGQERRVLNSR